MPGGTGTKGKAAPDFSLKLDDFRLIRDAASACTDFPCAKLTHVHTSPTQTFPFNLSTESVLGFHFFSLWMRQEGAIANGGAMFWWRSAMENKLRPKVYPLPPRAPSKFRTSGNHIPERDVASTFG